MIACLLGSAIILAFLAALFGWIAAWIWIGERIERRVNVNSELVTIFGPLLPVIVFGGYGLGQQILK